MLGILMQEQTTQAGQGRAAFCCLWDSERDSAPQRCVLRQALDVLTREKITISVVLRKFLEMLRGIQISM